MVIDLCLTSIYPSVILNIYRGVSRIILSWVVKYEMAPHCANNPNSHVTMDSEMTPDRAKNPYPYRSRNAHAYLAFHSIAKSPDIVL